MKLRRKGVLAAGLAVLAAGATVTGASAGGAGGAAGGSSVAGGRPEGSARDALQVFYSPPVLVRAGEAVRIPVDASCATEAGGSCPVSVTFSTPDVGGAWRSFSNPATPGLAFDLSASASAAVAVRASGFRPVPDRRLRRLVCAGKASPGASRCIARLLCDACDAPRAGSGHLVRRRRSAISYSPVAALGKRGAQGWPRTRGPVRHDWPACVRRRWTGTDLRAGCAAAPAGGLRQGPSRAPDRHRRDGGFGPGRRSRRDRVRLETCRTVPPGPPHRPLGKDGGRGRSRSGDPVADHHGGGPRVRVRRPARPVDRRSRRLPGFNRR